MGDYYVSSFELTFPRCWCVLYWLSFAFLRMKLFAAEGSTKGQTYNINSFREAQLEQNKSIKQIIHRRSKKKKCHSSPVTMH